MKRIEEQLKNIIRKKLSEMPMDFDTNDRPDPSIERKLRTGDTSLKKVPMPLTGREPNQNFQEKLATERYQKIVERVRRYAGLGQGQTIQNSQRSLVGLAFQARDEIIEIESQHLNELEDLAIRLVSKEMGIPEGAVQWDCKIEQPTMSGFKHDQPGEQQVPDLNPEMENEIADNLENLNFERAKRRLVNSMVQGSATKGQYMFHMVEQELNDITGDPTLINKYGILMSVLDTQYWQFSDEAINSLAGSSLEGKEEVDRTTNPPTIHARGTTFPILVHEIVKGLMELFSHQAEPEDKELFSQVEALEGTLEKEVWDLRLGPSIWERIRSTFPQEVLNDETKYELQNWILVEIFKLPARKFLVLAKEMMAQSDRGKQLVEEIYEAVKRMLNNEEPLEETEEFTNDLDEISEETSDEDINDFLNGLESMGIGRAKATTTSASTPSTNDISDKDLSGMGLNELNFQLNKAIDDENWPLAQRIQAMIDRKENR